MSLDIMVYIAAPLSEVIDQWQAQCLRLDERYLFESEAKSEIKGGGEFNGFFPVGKQSGFELYVRPATAEDRSDKDAPPQLANARYVLTFATSDDAVGVGFLCAGALAMVGTGVVYDTFEGVYLSPEEAIAQGRDMS